MLRIVYFGWLFFFTAEALTMEGTSPDLPKNPVKQAESWNAGTSMLPPGYTHVARGRAAMHNLIKGLGNLRLSCYRSALTPTQNKKETKTQQRKRPTSQESEESAANQCIGQRILVGVCIKIPALTITVSHSRRERILCHVAIVKAMEHNGLAMLIQDQP